MGNSTISMAIFNSYVSLPEGKNLGENVENMLGTYGEIARYAGTTTGMLRPCIDEKLRLSVGRRQALVGGAITIYGTLWDNDPFIDISPVNTLTIDILVGGAMCPSWKMMEFVNGKDHIPYMENTIHVWNHQPELL